MKKYITKSYEFKTSINKYIWIEVYRSICSYSRMKFCGCTYTEYKRGGYTL